MADPRSSDQVLRLAFVAGTLEVGGAERQLVRLAIEMDARGHDVRVLALLGGGPLEAELHAAGVATRVCRLERGLRASRWQSMRDVVGGFRFLLAGRPDVVHVRLPTPALLSIPVAWLFGVPVRVLNRVEAWPSPSLRRSWQRGMYGFAARVSSRIVANSVATATQTRDLGGVAAGKVSVLPNGLDLPARLADTSVVPPVGMIVANLRAVKGHPDLIAALARLKDPPTVRLVGGGTDREALQAQVDAAGLTDRVIFEGQVLDGAERFQVAQFALLTSLSESSPNAVLEAMGHGLPVVATAVGGVPELVIDERTGLLVPPGAPEELAKAIERIAADPLLRQRLGRAGRLAVEVNGWPRVADRHEELYRELLAATRRGRARLRRQSPVRLRITLVIGTLDIGGAESQLVRLACELHRAGHAVTVVVLGGDGPLGAELRAAGVPYRTARFDGFILRRPLATVTGLLRLWWHVLRARPQVVDARLAWSCMLVMPLAWLRRVPVRIAGRRAEWQSYRAQRAWQRSLHRLATRCATALLANSQRVADGLVESEGVRAERVHVIPNGLDLPTVLARADAPEPVGMLVANLRAVKAQGDLIEALALLESPPRVRLVGDGPDRAALVARVAELGLEDTVIFEGRVPYAGRLFSEVQFGLLTSHSEGLPNVVLEAMAAGLPVVATAVGGVTELVEDGVTGLLVDPADPPALAQAIRTLVDDPERRAQMGAAARRRAEAYSWERCRTSHEELYRHLLTGSPAFHAEREPR